MPPWQNPWINDVEFIFYLMRNQKDEKLYERIRFNQKEVNGKLTEQRARTNQKETKNSTPKANNSSLSQTSTNTSKHLALFKM